MGPMDEAVLRSLGKWPDVPAVYGWLMLDARGNWLLRNPVSGAFERIGNVALREFIARNYACDELGRWFFQNGPQRVYVRLVYTPLVFRLAGDRLKDHCGRNAGRITEAWLDERGSLVLRAADGVGVLEDRDLLRASEGLVDAQGAPASDPARAEFFVWGGARTSLGRIASRMVPERFNFVPDPRP
jgi:hypothetical protein